MAHVSLLHTFSTSLTALCVHVPTLPILSRTNEIKTQELAKSVDMERNAMGLGVELHGLPSANLFEDFCESMAERYPSSSYSYAEFIYCWSTDVQYSSSGKNISRLYLV